MEVIIFHFQVRDGYEYGSIRFNQKLTVAQRHVKLALVIN